MLRTHPQMQKKSDSSVSRKGSALKAMKKMRTKRIRRHIEKAHLTVKDPDVAEVGEVVEFEPAANQILKGVTTHGRKMRNDPIFRRHCAIA